jgi:2-keto-4-pentenoate hydratase/2-oxohepta-3-ene-1,7-dioic acid hydratase in catechol pathway
MKLAFFDDFRLGVIKGDNIVDVTEAAARVPYTRPQDLIAGVIADFASFRSMFEAKLREESGVPLASVTLRPPLPRPGTIVCMAVNYMEDGTRAEPAPINGFLKSPSAIIGPGDTMELPDVPARVFEGEAEFAVVIGKRAKNVRAADAMAHVFGYVNFIDGSARGLPPAGNTFYQMKSRDTFAPIGPYLVTADEIADPNNLPIELRVNGVARQKFNSSDMAHKIPRCIEWASSIHTLEPGDLLATGTNHRGLSAFHDRDVIELETAGLGCLRFNVRDALDRRWARETRLERQSAGLDPIAPQLSGKYAPAK